MQFQTADISIVRSIRQVSLVRDWQRSRGQKALPNLADFTPNERAGDAADILMNEVTRQDGKFSYLCRSAGERVAQIFGLEMISRRLEDCLDAGMAKAARPIWDACVNRKLPVYSILPLADQSGCPVTIEQLFLPYSKGSGETDVMLAVLHAWSTEGRFAIQGLLRGLSKVPLHWAVVVDPEGDAAPRVVKPAVDEIVWVDHLGLAPEA
ncbi:MAG: hypothetical protein BGP05_15655 [Rhizobiales bacterium 62-47]|nr:PAS domain-containing protein [Hyphomicrobiales bacterium]OJY13402.1 MAG: hypothetical protein BGP05_15655 [Rhizobiales bacterium 62-47]